MILSFNNYKNTDACHNNDKNNSDYNSIKQKMIGMLGAG